MRTFKHSVHDSQVTGTLNSKYYLESTVSAGCFHSGLAVLSTHLSFFVFLFIVEAQRQAPDTNGSSWFGAEVKTVSNTLSSLKKECFLQEQ
jgi:hypothetical protein